MAEAALRRSDAGSEQASSATVDVKAALEALVAERLTPKLVETLQNPQHLGVLKFELGKAFDKANQWFAK